ncbi:hypothetical protein BDV96DRAFT_649422 [Lophiotrema nucula]|uniref:Uncharacterized protein n=1 Tax=Lophiotrema nucula TaxID=690887 RepID=A0A6A5YY77_9PLEO|nr:hypothetical protein BDV96DRAFT_649422 [Lophiotrema nucula]
MFTRDSNSAEFFSADDQLPAYSSLSLRYTPNLPHQSYREARATQSDSYQPSRSFPPMAPRNNTSDDEVVLVRSLVYPDEPPVTMEEAMVSPWANNFNTGDIDKELVNHDEYVRNALRISSKYGSNAQIECALCRQQGRICRTYSKEFLDIYGLIGSRLF